MTEMAGNNSSLVAVGKLSELHYSLSLQLNNTQAEGGCLKQEICASRGSRIAIFRS